MNLKPVMIIISFFMSMSLFAKLPEVLKKSRQQAMQELFINKGETKPLKFTCATGFLTTSVVVLTEGKTVTLRVIHHNGMDYAPIHSGIITMADLPKIQKWGSELNQTGPFFEVQFDLDHCQNDGEGTIECFHPEAGPVGGLPSDGFAFQTHTSVTKIYGTEYKTFHFNFSALYDHFYHDMEMQYSMKDDCLFE